MDTGGKIASALGILIVAILGMGLWILDDIRALQVEIKTDQREMTTKLQAHLENHPNYALDNRLVVIETKVDIIEAKVDALLNRAYSPPRPSSE